MEKKKIYRIAATVILLISAAVAERFMEMTLAQRLVMYLVPYLLIGYDVIMEAIEGIMHGEALEEDFLMCVATIGALSVGFLPGMDAEFMEAVFVMLFFQIGELFQDYAENRSKDSISHLMNIRPDVANVERCGKVDVVSPDAVEVGEIIVVRPGEKIPLDGIVDDGESSLNTLALTGESLPRDVRKDDEVFSGCVNISGVLKIKVTKSFGESTASKIISLVENASENKSKSVSFISKFARVYTPIVVFLAIAIAFVPPLLSSDYFVAFPEWLNCALTFLVVSCPCALVISVPLTFFCGIGGASKNGILIKGGNYMDALSRVSTVVFDKTGTLTKGKFEVEAVHPENISETQLLHLAAHVERFSTHPIAISLRDAYPDEHDDCQVDDVEEIAGRGVRAVVNGKTVCVGNTAMMDAVGAKWHQCHKIGSVIHVAVDGEYVGHIVISDKIKPDSKDAVKQLDSIGVKKTVMLTGDRKEVGENVAREVGIDECYAELLPSDKVSLLENILRDVKGGEKLAFVGDGINDAPVLARADVGVAMGGLGSDAAIEASDVVIMDDKPSKVAYAIDVSRYTIRIANENALIAILIKLLVLVLAGIGVATMWMAVFADVGVTVLAVLNAMRALGYDKNR